MIKIIVAGNVDLAPTEKLNPRKFSVTYQPDISNDDIIEKFNDYDVIVIRSTRKIDRNFLEKTSFRIIATCTKGTDHIDTVIASKQGVVVLNADDSNNISAAEHTLGLLLSIFKKINYSDKLVRDGRFSDYEYERNELFGKSIGIIGFGKVGSYVALLCKAFGMKVYANDIDKNVISLNKDFIFKSVKYIFKRCDIVTIHIPLSKKNFHFISKEKLKFLTPNSVLINTSRGDVIDEKFLLKILKNKKIKFAGLDVFSGEPAIDKGFRALDNVLLTNHIAGKTMESKRRVSENIFGQITKFYQINHA